MEEKIIAIVCPDIHGRPFWKQAASEYDGSVPFIFLGDYLDAYDSEHINPEEVKHNFEEIWGFKKKWGDNVILLLGNHDLSYKEYLFRCCRFSFYSADWYQDFLRQNWEFFKFAHQIYNNGKTIIFSHAGIHPLWLKENDLEEIYDADYINSLFIKDKRLFTDYSYHRGGYLNYGSPIWADIREFINVGVIDNDIIQVVGHTKLKVDKLEFDNICCIDSKQPFVMTTNNKIETYEYYRNKKEE
jgi:hypothetical protein